jgi:hypothetical protein
MTISHFTAQCTNVCDQKTASIGMVSVLQTLESVPSFDIDYACWAVMANEVFVSTPPVGGSARAELAKFFDPARRGWSCSSLGSKSTNPVTSP